MCLSLYSLYIAYSVWTAASSVPDLYWLICWHIPCLLCLKVLVSRIFAFPLLSIPTLLSVCRQTDRQTDTGIALMSRNTFMRQLSLVTDLSEETTKNWYCCSQRLTAQIDWHTKFTHLYYYFLTCISPSVRESLWSQNRWFIFFFRIILNYQHVTMYQEDKYFVHCVIRHPRDSFTVALQESLQ